MAELAFVKPERIFLKDHPQLNEKWVQVQIARIRRYWGWAVWS